METNTRLKADFKSPNGELKFSHGFKKISVFDYVNLRCCLLLEIFNFCFWNRLKGKAGNANLGNKKLFFQVSLKYFQVFKFYYLKTVQGQNKERFWLFCFIFENLKAPDKLVMAHKNQMMNRPLPVPRPSISDRDKSTLGRWILAISGLRIFNVKEIFNF